jgi:hypothetical protein
MSLQTIIETALSQKVMTVEMEARLRDLLFSHQFSFQELMDLEILTKKIEAGEIKILVF